ncbi:hypothetical protein CDAR_480341 [Caerostris darwini]|uniref:Uncharacterized protein n=1 Tax=Caerostris darwini TaxID=1538125 RepID=A0AAV4V0Y8_9ARAC|nr:hypothetical protein CDAR_480341 [Caerostris darwini]
MAYIGISVDPLLTQSNPSGGKRGQDHSGVISFPNTTKSTPGADPNPTTPIADQKDTNNSPGPSTTGIGDANSGIKKLLHFPPTHKRRGIGK